MRNFLHNHTATINSSLKHTGFWMIWMICLVASQDAWGQTPNCNTIMACNDGVQVSLDENCQAIISPDMILEDPLYDNSFYTVSLRQLNGTPLPAPVVNGTHIGDTLEVRVRLNGCDLSCWGHITIEDKLPPVITNCPEITVSCTASTAPGGAVTRPTAIDACSSISLSHADDLADLPCSEPFGRLITRRWVARDGSGNTDTCFQEIFVQRADLSDVVFPPNYDDIDRPSFSCDNNLPKLPNGAPNPSATGFPSNIDCPNIQFYYTDIVFELCGASQKVFRQWVVIDWCTGAERVSAQVIKIVDDQPPVCVAPDDDFFGIGTDPGKCTGTFNVPAPNVVFECSDWDYEVGYKLRDEDGDPFENPIFDNVTRNADGTYTITDLPMDTTWIVYIITDACGNSTMCFTEVFVNDTEKPTPICEGFTIVSLDNNGFADLFAESVDDHSKDNCGIDRFEIRRETDNCDNPDDLNFGETIDFCCEDVAVSPIKVIMRVYDHSGNYNDCVVNVTVQDKMTPTIQQCPPNITLDCGQDPTDMTLTGGEDLLVASDNCALEVTSRITGSIGNCGTGTVRRIWTVTDPQDRIATCTQTITVSDSDPFSEDDIIWPDNIETEGCTAANASPEELNSFPLLSNTDCADIAMSYEDEEFYNFPGVCVKVLRHWRVANWCNVNSQNPSFFEYTQKIELNSTEGPRFLEGCQTRSFDPKAGECDALVTITALAEDDCTPADRMKYAYTIDIDKNGSIDFTGNGRTINQVLPHGQHRISFTATNLCGVSNSCNTLINITDRKAPTPICYGSVTWVIDETGSAEVWASDFNLKSFDDCTPDDQLRYAFNATGTQTARTFTCDDLPNGVGEGILLNMYVLDPAGNSSFCEVELVLQDNGNHCDDSGERATIGGYISTYGGEGIEDIEVDLMNLTASEEDHAMTKKEGDYAFEEINFYDGYEIRPVKNDDYNNGVSTLDLVLIQRHILNIAPFTLPHQYIAADINNSESLSGADIVELRKLILGKVDKFENNDSWRFVDQRHEFEDTLYPYVFPEHVVLEELYLNDMDINFVGIKVGDINNTAKAKRDLTNGALESRSAAMSLLFEDLAINAGDKVFVNLYTEDDVTLLGAQLAIEYTGLQVVDVQSAAFSTNANNIHIEGNLLNISMDDANGSFVNKELALLTVTFEATQTGRLSEMIALSDAMPAEAYDMQAQPKSLQLASRSDRGVSIMESILSVSQNSPNPFQDATMIEFTLGRDAEVNFSIFDIAGRLVDRQTMQKSAGTHQIEITKQALQTSGVLYYSIEALDQVVTKRMIVIE